MNRRTLFLSASAFLLWSVTLCAIEPLWQYAVEASAVVDPVARTITLTWVPDANAVSYTISRKAPGDGSWKTLATLGGTATGFADAGVTASKVYEYQIQKNGRSGAAYTGYGYLQSSIRAPLVDNRGGVLLLVDRTYASQLATELARLQQDLAGDGWTVARRDVGRTDTVESVKSVIKSWATSSSRAVFLFGHVPVPYAGAAAPDEHPSHVGAWPADAFYGSLNGRWTDVTTNFVSTSTELSAEERARLTNVPRDGKYDPSTIPGTVDLQIGRVDLAAMPGYLSWQANPQFPSEVELLRNYLNKDHAYRHRTWTLPRRAVLEQFLGTRDGEAFAATGYRAFTAFFGPAPEAFNDLNVATNDQPGAWLTTLSANAYLWAYGDGSAAYSAINGLGAQAPYNTMTSVDLVSSDVKAAFVVFFGSWMGDWNTEDNLLRAVLATPSYGLASVWSGRPHWFFHPMALGETLGYCTQLTQNNSTLYRNQLNKFARGIHIALHGDPTLRLHPVVPPSQLLGTVNAGRATLTWQPSAEASLGYHVYRASNAAGPYTRLTSSPTTDTSFTDPSAPAGATYQVRACRLETSSSGAYENSSQGIFWTAP